MSYSNKVLLIFAFLASNSLVFAQTPVSTTHNTIINTSPGTTIVLPAPASTVESDGRLVANIYKSFSRDSALIGTTLTAVCSAAVCTISGNVTAQSQADEAYQQAKRVIGVKEVISHIVVITNYNTRMVPIQKNY